MARETGDPLIVPVDISDPSVPALLCRAAARTQRTLPGLESVHVPGRVFPRVMVQNVFIEDLAEAVTAHVVHRVKMARPWISTDERGEIRHILMNIRFTDYNQLIVASELMSRTDVYAANMQPQSPQQCSAKLDNLTRHMQACQFSSEELTGED